MLAHYRVEAPLGRGAMGTVYLAHDTSLERSVAVKVLHSEIAREPDIARRFEREARAAARVSHPNITHVYFVGGDDDQRFFVMEYVPGESLYEHVQEWGALPFDQALDVLRDAARGLSAAHEAGVIHRDVKPSNLMFLPDGSVKVADFGLAKSLGGDMDATGAGRVMGTPRYMSPEQCKGDEIDARTDVYSLGLTGFFLLSGMHAFDGETLGRVIADQLNKRLPDVTTLREDLPVSAHTLLVRLCAKDPDDRPGSMQEVLRLIEDARPKTIDPAPLFSRGGAFLIDAFLAFVLFLVSYVTVEGITFSIFEGVIGEWVRRILMIAVAGGLQLMLLVGMERRWGATPGKLAFQLCVVTAVGTQPSWRALIVRFVLRLPIFALLILPGPETWVIAFLAVIALQVLFIVTGVVCFVILDRRTMSDVMTGTRVVHQAAPTAIEVAAD